MSSPASSHYILYWSPGAVSMIVHWAFLCLAPHGVTYELRRVDFSAQTQKSEEYLRLNPLGQVPVLIYDDEQSMTEGIAILMFLAERHPAAHLGIPPSEAGRAKYLQTMVLLANSMLSSVRNWTYADRENAPDVVSGVRALAEKRMGLGWDVLDSQLEGKKYLLDGEAPTVADLVLVCCARYSRRHAKPATEWKNVRRVVVDLGTGKEYQEVCKKEDLLNWPSEGEHKVV